MTEPKRVAVLGAGYIGQAVARAVAAGGDHVWCVRRSATPDADGIAMVRGDVTTGAVAGLPSTLDAVVLTVAPGGADYAATYPPAARTAVAVARLAGAARVVYTSSTGVYGERDGAWVTEASPVRGAGPGNAALIEAEQVIRAATDVRGTVLRVAGIYGPGRDLRGRMRAASALPARGAYWTNLAHRDDIVRAILHTLSAPLADTLYNVSDGTPALAADIARWLAVEAGADPDALLFGNDAERSRNNQRVSSAALQATGWTPAYPSFRAGFRHGL
jgi:nucleoside-diphosphate-sugar epimerase